MPIKDVGENNPNNRIRYRSRNHKKPWIPRIALFLDTYRKEQKANREQEDREYHRHYTIEKWTLAFVVMTTAGVFIQAHILNSSDTAIHEYAEATTKAATAAETASKAALQQVGAADRQVTAMQGQLAVMQKQLIASQRPIVAVERFENFASADSVTGKVLSWTFRAYIKNSGNSEALNGHNHINLVVRPNDLPDNFDYHDAGSDKPAATCVITARQENWLTSFTIDSDLAAAIYRGDSKMFFFGWLEYDDILGESDRHRTEFSYKIRFLNDPLSTAYHEPMSFNPYGTRYNCIDKGCLYQPGHPPPKEAEILGPGVTPQ